MEADVSRAVESLKLRLTCLSSKEANSCAKETLQELQGVGLKASGFAIDYWANGLAEASDGWPRHLQTYMREVLKALAAQWRGQLPLPDPFAFHLHRRTCSNSWSGR